MVDGAGKLEFSDWAARWIKLARYAGRQVPDLDTRIAAVVDLWREAIPPGWERDQDTRLLDARRYCRGNHRADSVRRGEHAIEYDVLTPSPSATAATCLGARLVDGVNAVPLAKDAAGGRVGNVEADMLLLVRDGRGYRLHLVEVKVRSNNAWFAAIENLRQLRLFSESRKAQRLFHARRPELMLPGSLAVTAVVLAPAEFYGARGQKAEAVAPAQALLASLRAEEAVDARLATWESDHRVIKPV